MNPRTKTRAAIAMLVYMMTNAVLFGAGLIIALMASRSGAAVWIPVAAVASLIVAAPLAWEIAPRLRARNRPEMRYQPVTLRTQSRLRRR